MSGAVEPWRWGSVKGGAFGCFNYFSVIKLSFLENYENVFLKNIYIFTYFKNIVLNLFLKNNMLVILKLKNIYFKNIAM